MTISESLKRFRRERKLSQRQLAEKIGIPYQSYQTYEYGSSVPSANVAIKIAKAFSVTTDYVLGLSDEPCPKTADPALVEEMVDCRDALWQVLGKVDRILGGSTYGHLQNHEPAQRQTVHRADTATA